MGGSRGIIAGAAGGYLLYDQLKAEPFETVIYIPQDAPARATPAPVPQEPELPTWADDIARAHTLLSRDTFSTSLLGEGNADLVGFKISKVFGKEFSIPDLSADDLVFQRAQMLQHKRRAVCPGGISARHRAPLALY